MGNFFCGLTPYRAPGLDFVKGWVCEINVPGIHLLFAQAQALAKTLEMDNFPLTQETDDVVYVRVVGQPQNVIIGKTGFLLWCNHESATWG